MWNEKRDLITDVTKIKKILERYHEQLYDNKSEKSDELGKFPKNITY